MTGSGETEVVNLAVVEAELDERWGRSVHGWTVVRSGNPPCWHGFCGVNGNAWAHHIEHPTLIETLTHLLHIGAKGGEG